MSDQFVMGVGMLVIVFIIILLPFVCDIIAENPKRQKHRRCWNKWFAWRPVVICIKDYSKEWVWLRSVERKGKYVMYRWRDIQNRKQWAELWEWKYRLISK